MFKMFKRQLAHFKALLKSGCFYVGLLHQNVNFFKLKIVTTKQKKNVWSTAYYAISMQGIWPQFKVNLMLALLRALPTKFLKDGQNLSRTSTFYDEFTWRYNYLLHLKYKSLKNSIASSMEHTVNLAHHKLFGWLLMFHLCDNGNYRQNRCAVLADCAQHNFPFWTPLSPCLQLHIFPPRSQTNSWSAYLTQIGSTFLHFSLSHCLASWLWPLPPAPFFPTSTRLRWCNNLNFWATPTS